MEFERKNKIILMHLMVTLDFLTCRDQVIDHSAATCYFASKPDDRGCNYADWIASYFHTVKIFYRQPMASVSRIKQFQLF